METCVDTKVLELTEAQNAAIYSIDRGVAIVAGAGSGKTTVLIDRYCHIVGDDWEKLDSLLAITFTERAAGELKGRLRKKLPARELHRLETAWIGTFHAFCARVLRNHAPIMGLDPQFAIMDENSARLTARQCIKTALLDMLAEKDETAGLLIDSLDFRNAVGVLEDLMDFRWHARRVLKDPKSSNTTEEKVLNALARVYERCEANFAEGLGQLGALDFQALEIAALELLRDNKDVLESYRKKFKHILVDEFQDTSDLQTELVNLLNQPGANHLCIVGDPRQSIYRFRGANIACFAGAIEHIKRTKGETAHLAHNFRSQHGIVNFVNRSQEELKSGLFGALSCSCNTDGLIAGRKDVGAGRSVRVLKIDTEPNEGADCRRKKEAEAIAAFIRELEAGGKFGWGGIVCLFQALTDSGQYETAFRKALIPHRFFGGQGLLERMEVIHLIHALRFAANPTDGLALLSLLRSPLIGLSDDDLVLLAGSDGKGLAKNAMKDGRCHLLKMLATAGRDMKPSQILREVLEHTGFSLLCHRLDPSGGQTANIERFLTLALSVENSRPTTLADFADFISELREHSARLADPPSAGMEGGFVRCMTVHSAKGLEFPVVILPDLFRKPPTGGGNWLFNRNEGVAFKLKDPLHPFGERIASPSYERLREIEKVEEEAESKRLLYVAMTRAMDMLVLPLHGDFARAGRWHKWLSKIALKDKDVELKGQPSPFSTPAGGQMPEPAPSTSAGAKQAKAFHPASFSVSQLECFARCPREYYLKYILALPSEKLVTTLHGRLPANIMGTIVHSVLEKLGPEDSPCIDALIDTECLKLGILPDDAGRRELQKMIDSACSLPLFCELKKGSRELPFDWRVGRMTVRGTIDWLLPSQEGFRIVDFKTDRVEADGIEERAREYELQMACYTMAVKTATGQDVIETKLAFLRPALVHSKPVTEERLRAGRNAVEDIIGKICDGNFRHEDGPRPCIKCPYKHNEMCGGI